MVLLVVFKGDNLKLLAVNILEILLIVYYYIPVYFQPFHLFNATQALQSSVLMQANRIITAAFGKLFHLTVIVCPK